MPTKSALKQQQSSDTTTGARYDGVAQLFHWSIVALLLLQYLTKWISPGTFAWASEGLLNAWHLGVGPTILALMLLRFAWRLTHSPPPPPADLPPALQWLSRATHLAFYGILVSLPILGWIAANGYGAKATLAGLVPLPDLVTTDKPLAETIGGVHGTLAWTLLAIIVLHVSGALYHALVKRDRVLQRMLPASGADAG